MMPIKRLMLVVMLSLTVISRLSWATSPQELAKAKTGCDSGSERFCAKLESIALHDKKLEMRIRAISSIANRSSLERVANYSKAASETRQAAIRRIGELEEVAWQSAQRSGTKEAYLSFEEAFPDNKREEDIDWALHEDTPLGYDLYLGRVRRGELQGKYRAEASRRLRELLPDSPLSEKDLQGLLSSVAVAVAPHSISEVYGLCVAAAKKVDEPGGSMFFLSSVRSGSTNEELSASKDHVLDGIAIEKSGTDIRLIDPVPSSQASQALIPFRHVLVHTGDALTAAYLNVEGQWYKWR